MVSRIYLNEWSAPLVGYNKKHNRKVLDLRWKKRSWIMLSETYCSYYQMTLGRDILKKMKKKNTKEKCSSLKKSFS